MQSERVFYMDNLSWSELLQVKFAANDFYIFIENCVDVAAKMLDIIKVCLQQVQHTKSKVWETLVAYTEGACTKCQTN